MDWIVRRLIRILRRMVVAISFGNEDFVNDARRLFYFVKFILLSPNVLTLTRNFPLVGGRARKILAQQEVFSARLDSILEERRAGG